MCPLGKKSDGPESTSLIESRSRHGCARPRLGTGERTLCGQTDAQIAQLVWGILIVIQATEKTGHETIPCKQRLNVALNERYLVLEPFHILVNACCLGRLSGLLLLSSGIACRLQLVRNSVTPMY